MASYCTSWDAISTPLCSFQALQDLAFTCVPATGLSLWPLLSCYKMLSSFTSVSARFPLFACLPLLFSRPILFSPSFHHFPVTSTPWSKSEPLFTLQFALWLLTQFNNMHVCTCIPAERVSERGVLTEEAVGGQHGTAPMGLPAWHWTAVKALPNSMESHMPLTADLKNTCPVSGSCDNLCWLFITFR